MVESRSLLVPLCVERILVYSRIQLLFLSPSSSPPPSPSLPPSLPLSLSLSPSLSHTQMSQCSETLPGAVGWETVLFWTGQVSRRCRSCRALQTAADDQWRLRWVGWNAHCAKGWVWFHRGAGTCIIAFL